MQIFRFGACYIIALSWFVAAPTFGQGPAKAPVKSITVYKTPT